MTAHIEPAPLDPPADGPAIERTWVFLPLFAPFGISSGFLSVTLGFQLGHAGLSAVAVTTVIAASLWAQSVKMLWAPIVDALGRPRIWYMVGAALTGLTILLMSLSPPTARAVPFLTIMAVIGSAASTLVSMSAEILLTHGIKPTARGRASGWAQAGNVGGNGVGGGLGLALAQHFAEPWISGLVLALICLACGAFLFLIPSVEPAHDGTGYVARLKQVILDVWSVARSRLGYLALIIMILPIASGSAPWSAIAGDWRADADLVALVTGVIGGLAAAAGALIGGYICDRLDPKTSYCLFGLAVGAVAVLMAWSPHTPAVFRHRHARLHPDRGLRLRGLFGDRAGGDRQEVGGDQLQSDGGGEQHAPRRHGQLRRLDARPAWRDGHALWRIRAAGRADRGLRIVRRGDPAAPENRRLGVLPDVFAVAILSQPGTIAKRRLGARETMRHCPV